MLQQQELVAKVASVPIVQAFVSCKYIKDLWYRWKRTPITWDKFSNQKLMISPEMVKLWNLVDEKNEQWHQLVCEKTGRFLLGQGGGKVLAESDKSFHAR